MSDAEIRERVARFLWKRDGLPVAAWDTGKGVIGCTRGPGGGMTRAKRPMDEMRECYLKSADELLAELNAAS